MAVVIFLNNPGGPEGDTVTMDGQLLNTQYSYGDKSRVFAKCISGGRPFDVVDIMLMTQSS